VATFLRERISLAWGRWWRSGRLDDRVFDVGHEVLGQEGFRLESFHSLQSYVVLSILLLDTGLLGILLAEDDVLTATWEVEHAEEELGALLRALFRHIVGLEHQVVVWGAGSVGGA